MTKQYTLGELAGFMGQADVLKIRITEATSQIGHKEHTIKGNEQAISQIESLKEANKGLAAEIDGIRKRMSDDEIKLNEFYKILKDNGVPVPDRLKGTTIVSI